MSHIHLRIGARLLSFALAIGIVAVAASFPTRAVAQQVTMETLLDRIQIEDLLVKYYYDLTLRRAHEMS